MSIDHVAKLDNKTWLIRPFVVKLQCNSWGVSSITAAMQSKGDFCRYQTQPP